MTYLLEDLLKLRAFRETEAANNVKLKTYLFNEAVRTLEQKENELAEYKAWRIKKEESLYEEITMKTIKLKKLDTVKQQIAMLRAKDSLYEKAVEDAKSAIQTASDNLEKARAQYRQAVRDKKKIEAHKKIWIEEWKKSTELAAEKELEDFRKRTASFADEDNGDLMYDENNRSIQN